MEVMDAFEKEIARQERQKEMQRLRYRRFRDKLEASFDIEKQRAALNKMWEGVSFPKATVLPKTPKPTKQDFRDRYKEKYPLKAKAQKMARQAVYRGKLTRKPCEICGKKKVQAHHDDYSKPLKVRWLCTTHHADWHKNNTAKYDPKWELNYAKTTQL